MHETMGKTTRANDAVHFYMSEITSRVVAESGNPDDRFHLGKIVLRCLKDTPDLVLQIDGATKESETCGESLKRTIRCATSFNNMGIKPGDVIVLMAPNNIHLSVPFQAALFTGITVAPVDFTFGVQEMKGTFSVNQPKLVFCQSEKAEEAKEALKLANVDGTVITFDNANGDIGFKDFLDKYGEDVPVDEYKASDFDPAETILLLTPTSGTTGLAKSAAVTFKNLAVTGPYLWTKFANFPGHIRMAILVSPLQWLTAIFHYLGAPMYKYTRLQSSLPTTPDHIYDLIKTYKPNFALMSPTFMSLLLKHGNGNRNHLNSLEQVLLGGSVVHPELIDAVRDVSPNTEVFSIYGMTELSSIAFVYDQDVIGTCGKPLGCFIYRLVDPETLEDINEPNVKGELWLKGPGVFKGYYNNPEATAETFSKDGWFRTGDLFFRDEQNNYFFVERLKLLLKYRNHHISPAEIEQVIVQHPSVLDAVVVGQPDVECGDLPVACVIKKPDQQVTAQEIKDLVKEKLTDSKQLRGGVVFLEKFPTTPSTKIARKTLKEMVMAMDKE